MKQKKLTFLTLVLLVMSAVAFAQKSVKAEETRVFTSPEMLASSSLKASTRTAENNYAAPLRPKRAASDYVIINEQPEGTLKQYIRTGKYLFASGGKLYVGNQGGFAEIVFADDGTTVYLKDPISYLPYGSWVKGTLSADGKTITVPLGQNLSYVSTYDACVAMGAVNYQTGYNSSITEATYTVTETSISLNDFTGYASTLGGYWTDDHSLKGYGDFLTVYTYFDEPETVAVPEAVAAAATEYPLTANQNGSSAYSTTVKVGWDGNDVYIQGLCPYLPEAWVKGTLDSETSIVTFDIQYFGKDASAPYFLTGYNSGNVATFEMKYLDGPKIFYASSSLMITISSTVMSYKTFFNAAIIGTSSPATPAQPTITGGVFIGNEPKVYVDIPTTDVDGKQLLTSELSYQYYYDVNGEVFPLTLTTTDFTKLNESMAKIPYDFTDNCDVFNNMLAMNMDFSTWNKIGIQSIYYGGGEENRSEIFWYTITPDITFTPANELTIQGGLATVTVGDEDMTDKIDVDGKLKVVVGQKVKVSVNKEGYKLRVKTPATGTASGDEEEVEIGDNSGSNTSGYFPTYAFYNYCQTEQIYTAEEIGTGGTINSLSFCNAGSEKTRNIDIFMVHTDKSSFASGDDWIAVTENDKVFSGSFTFKEGQWNTITLDTPFEYDGISNLAIIFDDNTGNWSSGMIHNVFETPTTQALYKYNDSENYDPYNMSTFKTHNIKNLIKLDITTSFVTSLEDSFEFEMPANDTIVNYSIVRDLSYETTLDLIINEEIVPAEGGRLLVVKNDDDGLFYATVGVEALLTDKLEGKTLTSEELYNAGMKVQYYLQQEDGSWEPVKQDKRNDLPVDLVFGKPYCVSFVGKGNSNYGGETEKSAPFTLVEAYWIYVPAGEYITSYQEKALYTENEDIKLYTVSSIEGDKALLSDPISIVPAETPILVFNNSEETKWYLLISTEDDPDDIEAASEFKGTLDKLDMPGSTEDTKYYACNGHDFVFVDEAGTLAANRCWIELSQMAARQLKITFPGNATGLSEELIVNSDEFATATWYTLEGRKLDKMPTKKGVYIMRSAEGRLQGKNGKKVVVK